MSESYTPSAVARKGLGPKPLTIYIKPSDRCTVGCTHCYLPEAVRADTKRMDDATFAATLQSITDMATHQKAPGVVIIWHGGEPLSLQPSYLMRLSQWAGRALPDAVQGIQTSLIPYSERWKHIIADQFHGEIGSSVDFTQRSIKGSNSRYLRTWLEKVDMARGHGFTVTPGIVPSKGELGRGQAISDWMADHGFNRWNIDRYNQFKGHDPMRPTNAEHSRFLTEVFDAVMDQARKGHTTKVNTVQAALMGVVLNQPAERWGGSCSHNFLVINPDGTTNACPDKISFERFSNIQDGYTAFHNSPERKAWIREHLLGHRNSHCATCPFQTFCRGGCPLTPNAPESEGECSGYNQHLQHVRRFAAQEPHLVADYLEAVA
jgi:radical SAM protein with 4Fe4S-binding SPASM domain